MNGPTTKIVPEINLDEFERRLRSPVGRQEAVEDPLAELTRLVDMISKESDALQKAGQPAPAPQAPRVEHAEPALPRASQYEAAPSYEQPEPLELSHEEREDLLAAAEAHAPAGRGRGWYLKTAGLAVAGVVLFGGAAAMKLGVAPGVAKAPPFIAAAQGPTKIQPPNDSTVQSAGDAGALLMKDSATSAPVKVVSDDEQPVDLHAQAPSPSPVPTASQTAAATSPATDSSPVAPSADTPIVAPGEATATVAPLFPDAKPVKTVSVRPDGTLISSDASEPASPPPAKTAIRVADNSNAFVPSSDANPQPATPKLDLPTKLSPKSSARVAKTDTTAPADATQTTPKPPAGARRASRSAKATESEQVADAAASDAPAASEKPAGGWVVQLSAPRTDAEAQSEVRRLKNKYADALGGADIGIHKAEIKGETIYRVRASGYSKAEAAALCAKLKGAGGDCFITRN